MDVAYKLLSNTDVVQGMEQWSKTNYQVIERMKQSSVLFLWINNALITDDKSSSDTKSDVKSRIYHDVLTQRLASNQQLINALQSCQQTTATSNNVTSISKATKNLQAEGLYKLFKQ